MIHRRSILTGLGALFAAPFMWAATKAAEAKEFLPKGWRYVGQQEPSIYPASMATDDMSDEEWDRVRDAERAKAGWMPRDYSYTSHTTYDEAFVALESEPRTVAGKQKY